jgi:two-component system KDP operon response regulator KdpE
MPQGPTILVVDDDPAIRRLLRRDLTTAGYRVLGTGFSRDALEPGADHQFDLVVLGIDPPAGDGTEVIRTIRDISAVPILALTSATDEQTIIKALDGGADACISKPFNTKELLARIDNILRRRVQERGKPTRVVTGNLEIDLLHRRVAFRGQEVSLSGRQYDVLRILAEDAGKVLSREEIIRGVWGPAAVNRVQYLRFAIQELRRKLEPDPDHPQYIRTTMHVGYRLEVRDRAQQPASAHDGSPADRRSRSSPDRAR